MAGNNPVSPAEIKDMKEKKDVSRTERKNNRQLLPDFTPRYMPYVDMLAEAMEQVKLEEAAPKVTLYCVRHAEAHCNDFSKPYGPVPDSKLTDYGLSQAQNLNYRFKYMDKITHIYSSPLTRTLQTATIGFKSILTRGIKIIAMPEPREFGIRRANHGTPLVELKRKFEDKPIDFSALENGSWDEDLDNKRNKKELRLKHVEEIRERLYGLLAKERDAGLEERDLHILVVTHGGILARITGVDEEQTFGNAEWRRYELKMEGGDLVSRMLKK